MIQFVDLSGKWKLCLDEECNKFCPECNDSIDLPNTTSNAGKGKINNKREIGFLTDVYKFEGWAWYEREVDFSQVKCENMKLCLERTRVTVLYIDEKEIGTISGLCTPHIYDLSDYIGTGVHKVTIKVSNVDYKIGGGHMTSPDTQTNWNGITGKIGLMCYGKSYVENVRITSDIHSKTFHITADIVGDKNGTAVISAESFNSAVIHKPKSQSFDFSDGKLDAVYEMGDDCLLWSEFEPNLYRLKIDLNGDISEHIAGMREFKTDGVKFTINGRKTFLRGKHDGMIFPKTGYAPCDVDGWLDVMKTAKSFGMNHYRFHTCCPPEAAFEAADILGIYLEPELPFWGTVTSPDEEDHNAEAQDFLIAEGFGMLRCFGNHPSFCMMSMGNELWGSKERINEIMGGFKSFDDRHLYTQGSNNFQFTPCVLENDDFFVGVRLSKERLIRGSYGMCDAPLGHVQTDKPSTRKSYDEVIKTSEEEKGSSDSSEKTIQIQYGTTMKTVKADGESENFVPSVPIVTHEIGQYETYPDFREIEKYTGPLKPRNFEVFRERLEEKGLLSLAQDYFECTGKLAAACYKEEMEAVFRSKLLGGFQILDIQDFTGQGTALIGMLNAFMENKGIISDEEWREFCADAVVLALFDSYTCIENTMFNAHIQLAWYRAENYKGEMLWNLCDSDGNEISGGSVPVETSGENYIDIGDISVQLPHTDNVKDMTLNISLKDTDVKNHYVLSLIPDVKKAELSGTYIFESVNVEARKLLDEGKTILVLPDLSELKNSIEGFYCQDFWCYPMFAGISRQMKKPEPVGTMGLLINNEHPSLAGFASKKYSTPQWWDIVMNSRSEIIDDCPQGKNVIVRTIDNFDRNHNLALLYEYQSGKGKVVVCNCDFDKLSESPEGRVFIKSIVDYVRN